MQQDNLISFDPAKLSDHDQSELEANIWISFAMRSHQQVELHCLFLKQESIHVK